jgi:transposase
MPTIEERLDHIELMLLALVEQQTVREWYSTDQVAQIVGKSEFTVREWARLKRIVASKRRSGRGAHTAWVISHTELLRLQKEGLLPSIERSRSAK